MSSHSARSRRRRSRMLRTAGPWVTLAMRVAAARYLSQATQYPRVALGTLDRILALNGATEFGRRHGLDGRERRRAFERLPVTTYADYVPYIQRIAAGEQGLLSAEPVVYFSTTSGTTGPPKMIPVTGRQMRMAVGTRMTSMGLALRAGVLRPMRGRFMTIMTDHLSGRTPGGLPTGAATTGGFRQLGELNNLVITSPPDVMRIHHQPTVRYLHMLFGLAEERLWTIMAFFPATILQALRTLQARAPQLLRDLADGTLDPELVLEPAVRARLVHRLHPERRRAHVLERLLEKGEFTASNIWPDLGGVLTATGGAFRFYVDQLRPLLGQVAVFSPLYSASEGTLAYGFDPRHPYYLPLPTLAYLELLPLDAGDGGRPVPAWEATAGRDYEVVVTTLAGLTRYRLNDVVRIVDFRGQAPVLEFVERRGRVIDVVGEKVSEQRITAAMVAACRAVHEPLVDYFVSPDTERAPTRYLLVTEDGDGRLDAAGKSAELLGAFDAALRHESSDYDEERQLGTLGAAGLVLLRPGSFERYLAKRVAAGVSASQVKMPHVVADPGFLGREFGEDVRVRVEGRDR